MSSPVDDPRPLDELRFALAEADAEAPPAGLRTRVVRVALDHRAAGRPLDAPEGIDGVEVFRRTVRSLDDLLRELGPAEWRRTALRGLDVQGLVGHLIGVEANFLAALDGRAGDTSDHVGSSQSGVERQRRRSPAETRREWAGATDATFDRLAGRPSGGEDAPVTLHGITLPLDVMLVVRAFEMWTHEEDIRTATGRPLLAPDPPRLARMTQLATTLVPYGMSRVGRPLGRRTLRLVLTGPGGGTWPLTDGVTGDEADAVVVADAVAFCRLAADRVPSESLVAKVLGDEELGEDLLVGVRALALD